MKSCLNKKIFVEILNEIKEKKKLEEKRSKYDPKVYNIPLINASIETYKEVIDLIESKLFKYGFNYLEGW